MFRCWMHMVRTWDHVINNFSTYLTLMILHDCESTMGALATEVTGECHVPLARVGMGCMLTG